MNNSMVFSYAARLRKMGNDYILSELGNAGLVDIVPSHGEILLYLLEAGTLRMGELTDDEREIILKGQAHKIHSHRARGQTRARRLRRAQA